MFRKIDARVAIIGRSVLIAVNSTAGASQDERPFRSNPCVRSTLLHDFWRDGWNFVL